MTHKPDKPEPIGANLYPLVFGVLVFAITILGAGITVYNSFHVPLANAVSCETAARVKADEEIKSNFSAFLMQNEKDHGKISNQLTRLMALMDRAEKSERFRNGQT
jgi:hypothetical protein